MKNFIYGPGKYLCSGDYILLCELCALPYLKDNFEENAKILIDLGYIREKTTEESHIMGGHVLTDNILTFKLLLDV